MYFLSKLIPALVYPLGLGLLLAVLALILMRFRRLARILLGLAILMIWVPSMPVVAKLAASAWERDYPPVAAAEQPQADAIVLLTGVLALPLPPRVVPDYGEAVDRVFEAARLYRADRAPTILVTGGNVPWAPEGRSEADLISDLLKDLGVPAEAIVIEGDSINTRQEAVNSLPILRERGWQKVLLVTSAFHMRRSLATFAKVGIDAIPASAEVLGSSPAYETVLDLLPSPRALADTTAIIKEVIGMVYYRLRGWA